MQLMSEVDWHVMKVTNLKNCQFFINTLAENEYPRKIMMIIMMMQAVKY